MACGLALGVGIFASSTLRAEHLPCCLLCATNARQALVCAFGCPKRTRCTADAGAGSRAATRCMRLTSVQTNETLAQENNANAQQHQHSVLKHQPHDVCPSDPGTGQEHKGCIPPPRLSGEVSDGAHLAPGNGSFSILELTRRAAMARCLRLTGLKGPTCTRLACAACKFVSEPATGAGSTPRVCSRARGRESTARMACIALRLRRPAIRHSRKVYTWPAATHLGNAQRRIPYTPSPLCRPGAGQACTTRKS